MHVYVYVYTYLYIFMYEKFFTENYFLEKSIILCLTTNPQSIFDRYEQVKRSANFFCVFFTHFLAPESHQIFARLFAP